MEKGPRRKKRAEKRNETERGQEREWDGKRVKRIEAEIRQNVIKWDELPRRELCCLQVRCWTLKMQEWKMRHRIAFSTSANSSPAIMFTVSHSTPAFSVNPKCSPLKVTTAMH